MHGDRNSTFIYALCDPDGAVRYIGKSDDPHRRLGDHLLPCSRKKGGRKNGWINGLLEHGQSPLLRVLEEVPNEIWPAVEREWITEMRFQGKWLVNGTNGGDGNWLIGPAEKKRFSQMLTGRRASEETRRKMSESAKRHWAQEGEKEKARCRAIAIGSRPPVLFGTRNNHAKLDDTKVAEIRKRHAAGESQVSLAREYAISTSSMCALVRGDTWRAAEGPLRTSMACW